MAMLDKKHAPISLPNDLNRYVLGEAAGHNVAIACLNEAGTNEAASVADQLKSSFKNIRFGLMVGIGGAVPSSENVILSLGCPQATMEERYSTIGEKKMSYGVLRHKGHLN
jgi:hypothetical protein